MTEKYLLDGIRVVELATFVFGPAAGTILGDFGVTVRDGVLRTPA